jgi:hypothetical protein
MASARPRHALKNRLGLACAFLCCTLAATRPAQADQARIELFLAEQGCVIGPSTLAEAEVQGLDRAALEAQAAKARADQGTVTSGAWLVLSPEACEIKPPRIVSKIKIGDPEVVKNLSSIDAYKADGSIGCYLDAMGLLAAVKTSRQWSEEEAFLEYARFLGASVIAGELAFYSPDPLRSPVGFQLTTGACSKTPDMPDIKRSHALLIRHFGALIRADSIGEATCENSGAPSWKMAELLKQISGGKVANAWTSFEVFIIAMGAGWFDGMSSTSKGKPRPPLCRYK